MFFQKPPLLLFLTDKSIETDNPKVQGGILKLNFPKGAVDNLEVEDPQKLAEALEGFVKENGLQNQRALMILSDSLLFTKKFPLKDLVKLDSEREKFISEVPFEPEKIAALSWQNDSECVLAAANKIFYETVKSILEKIGWEILGVYPQQFKNMLGQKELLKSVNFLVPQVSSAKLSEETETGNNSSNITLYIIMFSLLLLLGGTVGGSFALGLVSLPPNPFLPERKIERAAAVPVTPSPIPIPTPTLAEINKKDLKIQVLNGSGIAGQAGKVKELLEGLGFEEVETGNAENSGTQVSVAAFSQKVSLTIQNEVITELNKIFAKVSTQSGDLDPNLDILITTGKNTL